MEFGLSEEQKMLQESVRRYLDDATPLDRVREISATGKAFDKTLWHGLVELGATAAIIPQEHGGLGLSFLDATLIQENIGRYVAPMPYTAGVVMASIALLQAGTDHQKTEWLPKLATGMANLGIAVSDHTGARESSGISSSNGKLSGKTLFALDFASADGYIAADQDGALHLFHANADGLTKGSLKTIDRTRSVGELVLDHVSAEPLNAENETGAALQQVIHAGRILLAADTLGAAEVMIEKAVEYAKERKQFNRVIGSFQSVKHLCAEMAAELEPCRSLVWYAAHTIDEVPDEAPLMAAHAKSHLSEVGKFVARTATEVHGGIGFTDLLGLHYWFKRIGLNRQLLGSPERARQDAARLQGWAA